MTAEQLESALARHHCVEIEALHLPFDPNLHEAVGQVESAEHDPNHIVEETQRGYLLGEKLLRCSKVIVST